MDLGAPAAFAMDLAAHARFQCLRMDQRRVCYDLTVDPERCQSWRQWLHDQYPEVAREVSELERRRRDGEPEEPEKPKLTIVNLISDDEIHIEDGCVFFVCSSSCLQNARFSQSQERGQLNCISAARVCQAHMARAATRASQMSARCRRLAASAE